MYLLITKKTTPGNIMYPSILNENETKLSVSMGNHWANFATYGAPKDPNWNPFSVTNNQIKVYSHLGEYFDKDIDYASLSLWGK